MPSAVILFEKYPIMNGTVVHKNIGSIPSSLNPKNHVSKDEKPVIIQQIPIIIKFIKDNKYIARNINFSIFFIIVFFNN